MSERSKGVLLIVDHDPLKRVTLQTELSEAGYSALEAAEASSALQQMRLRPVDVVVTNLRMPGGDGLRLLEEVKATSPATQVILMTACGSIDSAVEAMKRGAADYLVKPFQTKLLLEKLDGLRSRGQWAGGQDDVPGPERMGSLAGQSNPSRQLVEQIRAAAANDRPALVQGEDDAGNVAEEEEVKGTLPEAAVLPLPEVGRGLTETIAGVERSLIDAALRRAAGNQAKAAQFLGIPRTTLRDKMAKHGMVGSGATKSQLT